MANIKMNLFTVYDSAARIYLNVQTYHTIEEAQRAFSEAVNSEGDHKFSMHPGDYVLFHLGEFDTNTGEIGPRHDSLGNGLNYIKEHKPNGELFEPPEAQEQKQIQRDTSS